MARWDTLVHVCLQLKNCKRLQFSGTKSRGIMIKAIKVGCQDGLFIGSNGSPAGGEEPAVPDDGYRSEVGHLDFGWVIVAYFNPQGLGDLKGEFLANGFSKVLDTLLDRGSGSMVSENYGSGFQIG